jgi:hypothetical protein
MAMARDWLTSRFCKPAALLSVQGHFLVAPETVTAEGSPVKILIARDCVIRDAVIRCASEGLSPSVREPSHVRIGPLMAAHFPSLQLNIISRAGCALLGLGQWKGEKERRSCGAGRTNAAAQTAGQLADDSKPSTAPDGYRYRPIVKNPALYDVACKHQLH